MSCLDPWRLMCHALRGKALPELPEALPGRCLRHDLPDQKGDALSAAWCRERGLPPVLFEKKRGRPRGAKTPIDHPDTRQAPAASG